MAVCRSTNDGSTWSRIYLSPEAGDVRALAPQPSNTNVVLAGGWTYDASWYRYSRMYRSTDGGSSWTIVGSAVFGTKYDDVQAIAWDPFSPNRVLAMSYQGLYASTDAGVTWTSGNHNLGAYDLVADPGRTNTFYMGVYNGVQVSTNGGVSWSSMSSGLSGVNVRKLSVDPVNRRLYAGTYGDGVYRFALPTDASDDLGTGTVPARLVLHQNYPNPFNPSTTIRFSVPSGGEYHCAVYDALGRQVAVLVDGPLSAGEHGVAFHASGVASGVYVVRLQGAAGMVSIVMTLLR